MLNEELPGHQETELDKGVRKGGGRKRQTPDIRCELARTAARIIISATRNVIYSYLFASSDI